MLPSLKKATQQQFQASQIKLYNPPRQLTNIDGQNQRKASLVSSSRANTKIRVMAGFRKGQTSYDLNKKQSIIARNTLLQQANNYSSLQQQMFMGKLNSTKDLSSEIKLIQKKIRYHKKKLEEEKKKKQQMQKNKADPYSNDFQNIIRKQMELQGYNYEQQQKGFDYLTNPGKAREESPQQIIQPQYTPTVIEPKKFDISQKVQKLEKHYENNLKKKFQRRQMFPHYPCKRKTPKLYITPKTNALQKFGKKPPQQEHIFRVMTRQCTPQQIYPTIPNFAIVKDNLSRNVMAYLGDYKPFIDKTREQEEVTQQPLHQQQREENQNNETNNIQNQQVSSKNA